MATGKNMLERNDINTTEALECPGCHRRYRRADFKSDRLTCPACGREVVALATVEEVDKADREKIIRKYIMGPIDGLDGWRGKIGCTGMVVLGVLFFVLIDSTFGTLAFIALSWFFMRLLSRERKVRHHILSLFENVDFDVEKGFAAHREYIKTVRALLGDTPCPVDARGEDCVYTRDVGVAAGHADMGPIWRLRRIGRCDCPDQWQFGRLPAASVAKGVSFGDRGKFPRCERKKENNEKGETRWVC